MFGRTNIRPVKNGLNTWVIVRLIYGSETKSVSQTTNQTRTLKRRAAQDITVEWYQTLRFWIKNVHVHFLLCLSLSFWTRTPVFISVTRCFQTAKAKCNDTDSQVKEHWYVSLKTPRNNQTSFSCRPQRLWNLIHNDGDERLELQTTSNAGGTRNSYGYQVHKRPHQEILMDSKYTCVTAIQDNLMCCKCASAEAKQYILMDSKCTSIEAKQYIFYGQQVQKQWSYTRDSYGQQVQKHWSYTRYSYGQQVRKRWGWSCLACFTHSEPTRVRAGTDAGCLVLRLCVAHSEAL